MRYNFSNNILPTTSTNYSKEHSENYDFENSNGIDQDMGKANRGSII